MEEEWNQFDFYNRLKTISKFHKVHSDILKHLDEIWPERINNSQRSR